MGSAQRGGASGFVFPVDLGASPTFSENDWHVAGHQGIDIFAPSGTPVYAVEDGSVVFGSNTLGGTVATLHAVSGDRYYFAHLSSVEGVDRPVKAGEVIGYVGNTGNAAHTSAHLHFAWYPGGGEAANPFPKLLEASRA
jgi:murein DD-endopeptidase MepM/ murein hydrolase activator NlpD